MGHRNQHDKHDQKFNPNDNNPNDQKNVSPQDRDRMHDRKGDEKNRQQDNQKH